MVIAWSHCLCLFSLTVLIKKISPPSDAQRQLLWLFAEVYALCNVLMQALVSLESLGDLTVSRAYVKSRTLLVYRTGWCSGNILGFYSGGTQFVSQARHNLSWLRFFVVCLSLLHWGKKVNCSCSDQECHQDRSCLGCDSSMRTRILKKPPDFIVRE